jgi:hypothetical protein
LLEPERQQWRRKCRSSLVAFAIEALASRLVAVIRVAELVRMLRQAEEDWSERTL